MNRSTDNVFHLAIPCRDLDESARFYAELGCTVARRYPDRVTLEFFGDQLVCHLAPDRVDRAPELYPRHFGITFHDERDFEALLAHTRRAGLAFFAEPFVRFEGLPEVHRSFVLRDPSNNLLEFKYYADPEMRY